jgi:hypothetical protein
MVRKMKFSLEIKKPTNNFFYFLEVELYYEYKQNTRNASSANARPASSEEQPQVNTRIGSSKSYTTELTEKSSIWETTTVASKTGTSFVLFLDFIRVYSIDLLILECF